jgi:hypothetical protein
MPSAQHQLVLVELHCVITQAAAGRLHVSTLQGQLARGALTCQRNTCDPCSSSALQQQHLQARGQ